jgi:hypothetical protein
MDVERARELSDLLEPTLGGARAMRTPYSMRAQVIVAVAGGVFAAVGLCAASSRRIGSLRSDAWLYAAATLVGAAWIVGVAAQPALAGASNARLIRYGHQLLGMAVVGAFYLRNRQVYRAMLVASGEETPSPWLLGIAAAAISWALFVALGASGRLLGA